MGKLIDFDGLFEEKLQEYMKRLRGKYTEEEWEELIPKLYREFGDTYIPRAKNTPKGYYAAKTDGELIALLIRHEEEGVPVSDYLCRELETRPAEALLPLLSRSDPALVTLAVNLLGANEAAFAGYFRLLEREDTAEDVAEAVCEKLKEHADAAKEEALALYKKGVRTELMLDVLSRVKKPSDEVFHILLCAFKESGEEMPVRAGYLANYGDPRALEALLAVIDREDINFLEYRELKYAIEALGGEYTRPRDFSNDPYFLQFEDHMRSSPEGGTDPAARPDRRPS